MFDGEAASLQALLQTNTVHVPKPVKVLLKLDVAASDLSILVWQEGRGM